MKQFIDFLVARRSLIDFKLLGMNINISLLYRSNHIYYWQEGPGPPAQFNTLLHAVVQCIPGYEAITKLRPVIRSTLAREHPDFLFNSKNIYNISQVLL